MTEPTEVWRNGDRFLIRSTISDPPWEVVVPIVEERDLLNAEKP